MLKEKNLDKVTAFNFLQSFQKATKGQRDKARKDIKDAQQ